VVVVNGLERTHFGFEAVGLAGEVCAAAVGDVHCHAAGHDAVEQ